MKGSRPRFSSGVFPISDSRGAGVSRLAPRAGTKPRVLPVEDSIFLARWPAVMTASDLDEHLEELVEVARQAPNRVAFVVDMTISIALPAQVRNDAAKKLAIAYCKAGHRVAGVSHVIVSPLVRGVVTAVHWLSPAPFPTHVAESLHESLSWGHAVVRAHKSQLRAARQSR